MVKILIIIISIILAIVLAVGCYFGITTADKNAKIKEVESLIACLPSDEDYYLDYQSEIVDAYDAYQRLDAQLQKEVGNVNKLMSIMEKLKVEEAYEQRQNMQFTKLDGGGYSVKLKEGANANISGELVIPEVYRQSPVVAIEDYAFENCRSITSVVVPDSITSIGVGAFKGCNNIKSMTLPFTGKSNDAQAYEAVFGYIFGYEVVTINEGGSQSNDFVNTKHGDVEQAVWQYTCNSGDRTYYRPQSYYYYIPTSIRDVMISKQSAVKDGAFNSCSNIQKITYSQTIDSLGVASFQNCESLSFFNSENENTINLDGSFNEIGSYAFCNCVNIKNVLFTENVEIIENNSFDGCKEVVALDLTNNITYIGDYAFRNLKRISELNVFSSTTVVGKGSFQGCNKLETITLPFTGRRNDAQAYEAVFGYVFGYEVVTINEGGSQSNDFVNTKHGDVEQAVWQYTCNSGDRTYYRPQSYYYYIPTSIRKVVITNQSNVKNAAFNGCKYIERIKYSKTIESFGVAAFQDCENLTTFNSDTNGTANLEGESLKIDDCCFKNCESINQIMLYDGLTTVGSYAFENTSITELIVPRSVTLINIGALKTCDKLEKLTVPFVGKSNDATAYEGVLGFFFGYETVTINEGGSRSTTFINKKHGNIDQAVWQYTCNSGDRTYYRPQSYYYYIPDSITNVTITNQSVVKDAAFNGCTMLETITFEKGISSQGEAAFQNCTATIEGNKQ